MDEQRLLAKIAEMRSYIASDWPDVEERKTLYEAIRTMESRIEQMREEDKLRNKSPR